MFLQHAIFTSVRSGRNEGYQIAGHSPGVSPDALRELTRWGPSHDALYPDLPATDSVNCHRLQSGVCCLSRTVLAGREYSGRGGQRSYTHMLLVPDVLLDRFGCNPIRIMEALVAGDRLAVQDRVPALLEPLEILGRASPVNLPNLEQVAGKIGAHRLASLVKAALKKPRLGVCASISGKRLFTALLDLIPPPLRRDISFTTGLRVSAARDYRLMVLPADRDEQLRAVRQTRLEVLDLTGDPPAELAPRSGWSELIYQLLHAERYSELAEIVSQAADATERDLDSLAEFQRERLERGAFRPLMPFSA